MIKDTMVVVSEKLSKIIQLTDIDITRGSVIGLIHIFEAHIKDIGVAGRCIFKLHSLIVIMFLAVLGGYNNASEFTWFANKHYILLEKLGLLSDEIVPSHDTFRRVLMIVEPIYLQEAIYEELEIFFKRVEDSFDVEGKYIQMAIDGKELCGTGRKNKLKNSSTLNIYNISRGVCVFSEQIDYKTNEIPVAQKILKKLNLKNHIISADALHTQTKTASIITNNKGNYLFNVKNNQELLLKDILERMNTKARYIKKLVIGKRVFEFLKVPTDYFWDDWPKLTYYVRYTSEKTVLYFISSLKEITAIAEAINLRWEIENGLHRNKDLLFFEDDIRYTNKNMSTNLALINNLALAFVNIAANTLAYKPSKKFVRKVFISEIETFPFKILKLLGTKNLLKLLKY